MICGMAKWDQGNQWNKEYCLCTTCFNRYVCTNCATCWPPNRKVKKNCVDYKYE